MRAALHVIAVVVVLPYAALAYAFVVLSQAIAGGSLLGIFDVLLTHAVWMIPWGILGATAAIVAIMVLGVMPSVRWIGALCLGVIAAVSLAIIVFVGTSPLDAGTLLFLLPCIGVLAFELWQWAADRRLGV
jgi:hypothetical protein